MDESEEKKPRVTLPSYADDGDETGSDPYANIPTGDQDLKSASSVQRPRPVQRKGQSVQSQAKQFKPNPATQRKQIVYEEDPF